MSDPSIPRRTRRAAVQSLESWRAAGITHVRAAPPVADVTPPGARPIEVAAEAIAAAPPQVQTPIAADPSGDRNAALCALAARVARCTRCAELARTRTQTVFGVGDPHARVMFIGEAPGADEDKQGEPFVGRAGQLLNRIIAACGWKREEVYICNILRCRPPGNRTPLPAEADNCREYLDGQIGIIQPEYIVCWGACAAQNLLKTTDSIGRMRQRWYAYGDARVLCTYHPSYLLRNPAAKRPVWEDMLMLLDAMGLKPPSAG